MNEDEGLTFALSPVQMAAIVRRKTVSQGETFSNRLWGDLVSLAVWQKFLVLAFYVLCQNLP